MVVMFIEKLTNPQHPEYPHHFARACAALDAGEATAADIKIIYGFWHDLAESESAKAIEKFLRRSITAP